MPMSSELRNEPFEGHESRQADRQDEGGIAAAIDRALRIEAISMERLSKKTPRRDDR
jgi:hypothetical protein